MVEIKAKGESLTEAVLRHLTNILELLAVSQTERVSEWDSNTALQGVSVGFQPNPAVRSALEAGLSDTSQRLRETLPSCSPVTFSELAQCQHTLLVHLLRDPCAPKSAVQEILDPQKAAQESQFDQNILMTCKSVFNLLCRTLGRTGHAGVQAEPLELCNDEYARTLLDSILQDSAGNPEGLYDVIAAAFHFPDDETSSVTQRCVLSWLREHEGCLSKVCRYIKPIS
ncbi:hypothetical protein cypCar_00027504 [Cyprinus carpio]|nr:hypothetical protein cypCar_00027504 [Cyprinus carpio]